MKSKNIRNHKQKFSRFLSEIVDYIKRINYKLFIRNRKFLLRMFFCGTSFYLMLESRRFWSSSYAVIFSESLALFSISLCIADIGSLLTKLFWPTVRKNCSSDWEKKLKFEAEGREFAKILRSLDQIEIICPKNVSQWNSAQMNNR